jgi:2-isopropylmalate synthase
VRYVEHHLFEHGSAQGIRLSVEIDGRVHLLAGEGNGPIDAAVHALRWRRAATAATPAPAPSSN